MLEDRADIESTAGAELFAEALKVLSEAMAACVFVADPSGRVRHANLRARALLGMDGASGASIASIPLDRAILDRLAQEPGRWEAPTNLVVDGQETPVRVAKHPVSAAGRTVGALVVVTETTAATAALADRDRARRDDRAKTRSLHMVAHDMGGPLTVLNGYVSLVLDGSIGVEQLAPYLPMLADQLDHMQRLVSVLLDTARLEEGRLELRTEPLDLGDFVESLVSRMRAPETGHQLVVQREAAKVPVRADRARLDSIVRNLVSNAIKYSAEGTAVTCTVRAGAEAELEVTDEGSGMTPEDLKRLFARFSRVGDQAANPAGVGLGLFLSRELARMHGGDLVVASTFGKGSTFTLRLPLRRENH